MNEVGKTTNDTEVEWLKMLLAVLAAVALAIIYLFALPNKDTESAWQNLARASIPSGIVVLLAAVIVYFLFYRRGLTLGQQVLRILQRVEPAEHVLATSNNQTSSIQLRSNYLNASLSAIEFIKENQITRAQIIAYSSTHVSSIIEQLKNEHCTIQLMIAHPENAVSGPQKKRIWERIDDLLTVTFADSQVRDNITIRFYRAPASLSGVRLEGRGVSLVAVGWYTYTFDADQSGIRGHDNPVIEAKAVGKGGSQESERAEGSDRLGVFFGRSFQWLWEREDTSSLEEVMRLRHSR